MQNPFAIVFKKLIDQQVTARVKLMLTDRDGFYDQQTGIDQRDRFTYDRVEILRQCLEAWRSNPLARRMIELTTQYIVGTGITVTVAKHKGNASLTATADFLKSWWDNPLNQLEARVTEWSDELGRSGEVFLLLSTDAAGMTYVRAVPAIEIAEVITAKNDLQQETSYKEADHVGQILTGANVQGLGDFTEGRTWQAYDLRADEVGVGGSYPPVMLHYAINRPAGAIRGESDLAPLLKWLSRYNAWLEDRVRLNKYRNSFLFVVKAAFASEAERLARQQMLNANPPNPGSIMVTDNTEEWSVIKPQLDTFEAKEDGLAIKKMICAGAGLPLHFLAEPEQTNRTTAESSSNPTFRHLEQRQAFFKWMLADLARAVIRRRAHFDRKVRADASVEVHAMDLSSRDNLSLANASAAIVTAFGYLHQAGLIDDQEYLRISYRFAGEPVDPDKKLSGSHPAATPPPPVPAASGARQPGMPPGDNTAAGAGRP